MEIHAHTHALSHTLNDLFKNRMHILRAYCPRYGAGNKCYVDATAHRFWHAETPPSWAMPGVLYPRAHPFHAKNVDFQVNF